VVYDISIQMLNETNVLVDSTIMKMIN